MWQGIDVDLQIMPQQVKARLDAGLPTYLLDVREPEEFAICHLPGSTLVPLAELPDRLHEIEPEENSLLVVYCHHGIRSLRGALYLRQNGFDQAVSMHGGTEAWSMQIDPELQRY